MRVFLFMQGAFHKRGRHLWEGGVKNWGKFMTQKQKSVHIEEEVVYRSGKSDDIIYEWPQEQQQAEVVLGAVHKVHQHFLGRMGQTLRKKWQQIGIKKVLTWGKVGVTNSKTSPDVIYGRYILCSRRIGTSGTYCTQIMPPCFFNKFPSC